MEFGFVSFFLLGLSSVSIAVMVALLLSSWRHGKIERYRRSHGTVSSVSRPFPKNMLENRVDPSRNALRRLWFVLAQIENNSRLLFSSWLVALQWIFVGKVRKGDERDRVVFSTDEFTNVKIIRHCCWMIDDVIIQPTGTYNTRTSNINRLCTQCGMSRSSNTPIPKRGDKMDRNSNYKN